MTQLDETQPTTNSTTTALDDPTLNALADDEVIEINWDEKERSGSYTPEIIGVHNFLFALEDDNPFEVREYDTKKGEHIKEFTINHKATVSYTDASGERKERTVRFQQAGFHQWTDKKGNKLNSQGAWLIRSLSILPEQSKNRMAIEQALREADGKVMGRAEFNWTAYCKGTDDAPHEAVSISTKPRKTDARWPKGADGKYLTEVQCPKCGAALAGREKITDYKLPQG